MDPKNVHTGPPTGSGRGPETPGSNVEECSSMNQGGSSTGHQYQYRPAQHQNHPPHTGVSQDCSATPVYHAGPLTTIMSSVNQPTIQVYGAVVPQPPVTLMSSQNPHATTPHPSAPPPVPAPVPPVVPLSQPQPAATTTIVAMAPITVTVPINPGTHSSPQSVGSPTSQSGGASAQAVSGSTHSSVALPQLTTAFVSGMSQPGIAPTQVTSVLSDMPQPVVTPAQVTTPMVSGIPQHSVTLTQVSSSISTGMSQTPIASPLATPFVSGMPQPTIAPTKVTAAVISGIPQTAIAPSNVTVTGVPGAPASSKPGGTQTSMTTAKLTEIPQVTVIPAQVTTGSVSCVPQSAVAPSQVLTAVVTGVPKPVTSVSHGITSGITEIPQTAPSPDVVDISDGKPSDKVDTQSPSALVPGLQQYAKDDNVDRGSKGTSVEYSNASNFGISQAAKIAARVSTAVVSGIPKTVVEITKTATAIVSGVPKSTMGSAQAHTAVVSGVQKTQVMHTQVSSCSITGVSKPVTLTAQSNTAVVSGVPRMSVAPTQLTSTVVPSASHPLKHLPQVTTTAISEKPRSIGLPLKDTLSVDHEMHQHNVSPSKISPEVTRMSKHTRIPNLGSVCTSEEYEKTGCASTPKKTVPVTEVQGNTTDAINSVPESYVACKGTANKSEAKANEGVRTTCPVSPMNSSGIEMKDVTKVKKENELQSSIIQEKDASKQGNTAHPMFSIPDLPNRVSRPNTSWSPTQHSITTEKGIYKQFATPVNHSSSSGCDMQHSHSVGKMSLSPLSCSTNISASNQGSASDSARSPTAGVPLTFQSKNACPNKANITSINASAASAGVPSALSNSKSKEEGISPLKEKSKAITSCNAAAKTVDDPGRTGLQRPGTRHLLCQTLPLTKTATASVAKAKSSSSTNAHRMLVKSEDKSKDTKPNIPESVPSSQSNPSPHNSSSSTITINPAKKEECGNTIDIKADIVRAEPIVRKRGRPPKVRDSSSDSSSNAPSETSSPSHHSGYRSPKMKPDVNTTPEKKMSGLHDPDTKRSRNSTHPFLGTKTLRSHSEERKKSLLQTSTVPTSPSKQVDCKQDIKPGSSMKMINIKTEVFPKIKTEKVSPKGVNKNLSPLKVSPKDISLFKNKMENGQDETSLKSSDLSRKCDLSTPTKVDEFTDTKKYIKGAKEIKKSPSGLLSDQRVPKNNLVISKSKLKDDEKKLLSSNTSLKRKSSESIGSSSKVISTKSRESETSSKAAGGAKHQAQKFPKVTKSTKGSTRRSCPNGKVNRKKSLLAYLKERNNESDTSSVDSEAAGGGRRRSKSKEESPKSNSASPFPSAFPPQPLNSGSRRRSATGHGKSKSTKKPRWVHNWSWEGEPFEGKIWLRVSK